MCLGRSYFFLQLCPDCSPETLQSLPTPRCPVPTHSIDTSGDTVNASHFYLCAVTPEKGVGDTRHPLPSTPLHQAPQPTCHFGPLLLSWCGVPPSVQTGLSPAHSLHSEPPARRTGQAAVVCGSRKLPHTPGTSRNWLTSRGRGWRGRVVSTLGMCPQGAPCRQRRNFLTLETKSA